jgi:hypothetical protein
MPKGKLTLAMRDLEPLEKERPMNLLDMLLKHEERLQRIESGNDKRDNLIKDSNHHLANMRLSLKLLKPITESVEKIEGIISNSEKVIELQNKEIEISKKAAELHKVQTEKDINYMTKQIDSIGPWIKWGVGIGFSVMGLFMAVMTALKIWG